MVEVTVGADFGCYERTDGFVRYWTAGGVTLQLDLQAVRVAAEEVDRRFRATPREPSKDFCPKYGLPHRDGFGVKISRRRWRKLWRREIVWRCPGCDYEEA